jgi:hypothetical protein
MKDLPARLLIERTKAIKARRGKRIVVLYDDAITAIEEGAKDRIERNLWRVIAWRVIALLYMVLVFGFFFLWAEL